MYSSPILPCPTNSLLPPSSHRSSNECMLYLIQVFHGAPALSDEATLGDVQVKLVHGVIDCLDLGDLEDRWEVGEERERKKKKGSKEEGKGEGGCRGEFRGGGRGGRGRKSKVEGDQGCVL